MVHKLVVDTCVWLDLSRDYREEPVIGALEDLIKARAIDLVVPQIIIDEFERNKARVIEDSNRSLQSHFRLVREAVNRFGDDAEKARTLKALNEVDHKIAIGSDAAHQSIARVEKLLKVGRILATTDAIKQRVTDRAIAKNASYHRERNSVGDAILIETYAHLIRSKKKSKIDLPS